MRKIMLTACHEPGHSWMRVGDNIRNVGGNDFHATHTDVNAAGNYTNAVVTGNDASQCQWSNRQNNTSGALCPWHVRQLRNSIFRTWTGADVREHRD